MRIVRCGWIWILGALLLPGVPAGVCALAGYPVPAAVLAVVAVVATGFMLYFFRDPEREFSGDGATVVSGADGVIRGVEEVAEDTYLKGDTIRISVFLNPFNVHVNRSPIQGVVRALAYSPGRHYLTIRRESSEYNEHSSILVEGAGTRCLVKQIVGPVVRRVVYWLNEDQELTRGERIGMMKFGSRLDVYFPLHHVEVLVKPGDKVHAGVTPIARIRKDLPK
jgi:phosphatidylserine decarboxylase